MAENNNKYYNTRGLLKIKLDKSRFMKIVLRTQIQFYFFFICDDVKSSKSHWSWHHDRMDLVYDDW